MRRHEVRAGRLRRRLTTAFILVAGISAGGLALGSFLLVRQARLSDSLERARHEARFDLVLAAGVAFSGPQADPGQIQRFLSAYRARGVDVVVQAGHVRFLSTRQVDPAVPRALAALVSRGQLAYARVVDGGRHLLLVGGPQPGASARMYFVFSEDRLFHDLAGLRNVLALGWLVTLMLSGVVGRVLASRTLAPVARASEAARSIAGGLTGSSPGSLDTRLPFQSGDEFGAWALAFNEMADALEGKIRALSEAQARERRFTSDVAHELRTPLTALVGEASLLRDHIDGMPQDAKRPAELLIRDVGRLRVLVEELMEISRLDSESPPVQLEPVDLTLLAAATVRARGWEARVDLRGQRLVVQTDRRRIERILANLIGNAIEHGRGSARVRVGRDGDHVLVEVADDGPGISADHLPHVFDRFYKADSARTGGSGLGLSIALENARLLGATIDAWSERGLGSRFTLRLAVSEPLPRGEDPVTEGVQAEARTQQEGGSP